MTLRDSLSQAEQQLRFGPHPDRARRDAETLLLHTIGKNKSWLLAHLEDDFGGCTAIHYAGLLGRRQKGEPIQYITGECEFYGLPFRVSPDVLIPRPETEHLVEKVLAFAREMGAPGLDSGTWESDEHYRFPRILDIGTGSGAIAIALAHYLTRRIEEDQISVKGTGFSPYMNSPVSTGALAPEVRSSAQITATDISASALRIAEENAARNGVCVRFLQGNLLAPVSGEVFDIIVSNPPYVPDADRPSLSVEVRDHEPSLALFAGPDGLSIYRRLIPQAFAALAPGGYLALEIGFGQFPAIHALLTASGFHQIEFTPDLQGIPRVVTAQRP